MFAIFIFFKATPSFLETSRTLVFLSDITVIKWENNKDIVSCITCYVTVFKRLFRKLLGLNRAIEYTEQSFYASHHPEYKWSHNKIIMKTKILSKQYQYLRYVTVECGVIKSNFFLSGGRVGCDISYVEWTCGSQV